MKTTAFKGYGPEPDRERQSLYPKVEEELRIRKLLEKLNIRRVQAAPDNHRKDKPRFRPTRPTA